MNNDILRKLIELACNNPNDNEANSAARKACRMIKEDAFRILSTPNASPFVNARPSTNRWPTADDLAREMERQRQREAANREAQERAARQQAAQQAAWNRQNEERIKREHERARQRDKYAGTTYTQQVSNMSCSKCGKVKATFYQGPAANFMCATCKYERDKAKRSAV